MNKRVLVNALNSRSLVVSHNKVSKSKYETKRKCKNLGDRMYKSCIRVKL